MTDFVFWYTVLGAPLALGYLIIRLDDLIAHGPEDRPVAFHLVQAVFFSAVIYAFWPIICLIVVGSILFYLADS